MRSHMALTGHGPCYRQPNGHRLMSSSHQVAPACWCARTRLVSCVCSLTVLLRPRPRSSCYAHSQRFGRMVRRGSLPKGGWGGAKTSCRWGPGELFRCPRRSARLATGSSGNGSDSSTRTMMVSASIVTSVVASWTPTISTSSPADAAGPYPSIPSMATMPWSSASTAHT